jgi:hypothetical protein
VKMFPVMVVNNLTRQRGKAWIPLAVVLPHEAQARANHDQTLQRLAERGGLAPCELAAVLNDRIWRKMDDADAWAEIWRAFARWMDPAKGPLTVDISEALKKP